MARTVKCPGCGADLTVKDDNRDFMFCEFCGTKIRLDDYQETHRFVDEARIQESKDAKELELKKMEQERWRTEDANKTAATYLYRKSTRLNSSHDRQSRMPSSA